MKLTIMNYDIDTNVEKDYQELSDKLSFLAIALYPKIDIKGLCMTIIHAPIQPPSYSKEIP